MMRFSLAVAATLLAAGCAVQPQGGAAPDVTAAAGAPASVQYAPGAPDSGAAAAHRFVSVIRLMEPSIEQQCVNRRRAPINCDFQFVVDDRPGLEPNAFQTVDAAGRPVIGFTLSLIAETRNADELAFVVGHEASHHILGHLGRKRQSAVAGAVILAGIATAYGVGAPSVQAAQQIGAQIGARTYSKQWELEADYLGAIVTRQAGFDPTVGAQFFLRLPDPGGHILGSHPSRSQRISQVSRAEADLAAGRAM